MRVPHDEDGKFFEEAKLAISISVSNSCPPATKTGKMIPRKERNETEWTNKKINDVSY